MNRQRLSDRVRTPHPAGPRDLVSAACECLEAAWLLRLPAPEPAAAVLPSTGFLFEMLVGKGGYTLQEYPKFFALFAAIYVIEPLLTRVYIRNMCAAGEKVRVPHRPDLRRPPARPQ